MFYNVAMTQEGKQMVLSSEEKTKHYAQNDIAELAELRGLIIDFDQTRPVVGKGKQGSTITKAFKERKKLRAAGKRTDY
ncbi:hypothetical protein [Paenibacillus medicaginis]|uniref:Uncharacterized protein n=1 Tax=Paenibacillus medicaginis TaxID=1470560 RepID=A0ABV5BUH4_9BACL